MEREAFDPLTLKERVFPLFSAYENLIQSFQQINADQNNSSSNSSYLISEPSDQLSGEIQVTPNRNEDPNSNEESESLSGEEFSW